MLLRWPLNGITKLLWFQYYHPQTDPSRVYVWTIRMIVDLKMRSKICHHRDQSKGIRTLAVLLEMCSNCDSDLWMWIITVKHKKTARCSFFRRSNTVFSFISTSLRLFFPTPCQSSKLLHRHFHWFKGPKVYVHQEEGLEVKALLEILYKATLSVLRLLIYRLLRIS